MELYRRKLSIIGLFILPAFLIYLIFAVIPIVQSVYFSFFTWSGIFGVGLEPVGFKNFLELLDYKDFGIAIKNVFVFTILNVAIQLPIGYLLAIILSSFCKGYRFFKTLFFSAVVLPITATALIWKFIFGANETGLLNIFLTNIGLGELSTAWMLQPSTALLTVIIANAWCGLGYHMTIGFAAVTGISEDVLESAQIDGATGFRKILLIIVPMIWEAIRTSIVLVVIGSLKVFDIVFVMTEGGPNGITHVLSTLMYYEAFKYNNYGLGSAISVTIFVLSILMAVISLRLTRQKEY